VQAQTSGVQRIAPLVRSPLMLRAVWQLNNGAGASSNQWGAKNSSTSQKPTYVKGSLVIE